MPHWYWEKKELRSTPSQAANLEYETEMRYRREGVRFIVELGKALNLSHTTMASGAVYFHRFYMFHSFFDFSKMDKPDFLVTLNFPKYVVATCCLFLAGKAEETPKKCRDIIKTVKTLTNEKQFGTFGVDPKEEVMILERVLLQTIKFDLQVDHPYSSLIKYAKCLKGDKTKLQKMVQMSWTFVNDSLCTTLCLQWEPEIIAIALMYLAAKLSKFEVKDWNDRCEWHKHWWDQYVENLDVDVLEDICHQVLDLYAQPHTPAKEQAESPPPGARPNTSLPTQSTSKSSSSQPSSRKSTPPPPRDAQPPPPPKSRPHTPPQPPMPHPSTAAIGAPPAFQAQAQQQQTSVPSTYGQPPQPLMPQPPLPVAPSAPPPAPTQPYAHAPPPQPMYVSGYPAPPPAAGTVPLAAQAAVPPPPQQRYPPPPPAGHPHGQGSYPYIPPPATGNPPPQYYNQPPPPPPTGSGQGYHRSKHSRY